MSCKKCHYFKFHSNDTFWQRIYVIVYKTENDAMNCHLVAQLGNPTVQNVWVISYFSNKPSYCVSMCNGGLLITPSSGPTRTGLNNESVSKARHTFNAVNCFRLNTMNLKDDFYSCFFIIYFDRFVVYVHNSLYSRTCNAEFNRLIYTVGHRARLF